jgi:plastocyanin
MKQRKLKTIAIGAALLTAAAGLSACGSSGGGGTRTIEADYHHDEFAGAFLGYYPRDVAVKPGMTVKFHQTWTGEPHSVSMGTIADTAVKPIRKLLDGYLDGSIPIPDEPPAEYDADSWDKRLPNLFGESEGLGQDAALPCYVTKESDLPLDDKACAKKFQKQVPFNGRQAYYSSGFIPFEGARGNTFEMKIAEDTKDGKYFYYCNVHGILMSGEITVAKDAKVESQAGINRRGKAEADKVAAPLKAAYDKELAGKGEFKGNLAGSGDESTEAVEGIVNEFTPRTINSTVGKPVTWTFINDHTISFNVPPYTPLFKFNKKGELGFNEGLDKQAGGWPGRTPSLDDWDYETKGPPPPAKIDAGSWDGSGKLHSSGTGWNTGDTYTITFTKKGTYPYACLIHPGMIGKVVVK